VDRWGPGSGTWDQAWEAHNQGECVIVQAHAAGAAYGPACDRHEEQIQSCEVCAFGHSCEVCACDRHKEQVQSCEVCACGQNVHVYLHTFTIIKAGV